MIRHFPRSLGTLLSVDTTPHFSLLFPTDPQDPLGDRNRASYRALLAATVRRALDDGWARDEVDAIARMAYDLLEDLPLWMHLDRGLAVYLSPTNCGAFRLPYPVDEWGCCGTAFLILPLLRSFDESSGAFALVLEEAGSMLYWCDRRGLVELARMSTPETEDRVPRAGIVPSAANAGGGVATRVDGTARTAQSNALEQWLWKIPGVHDGPLILAGDPALVDSFRAITRQPQLLPESIDAPDTRDRATFHRRVWRIVEARHAREQGQIAARYRRLLDAGLAASDPAPLLRAAQIGRIETLLVRADAACWGTDGRGDSQPNDRDLANLVAVHTLQHDGDVREVDHDALPEANPIAAILRY